LQGFASAKNTSKKNIILKIAGEGGMESALKNMATSLGISDSIKWMGRLEGKSKMTEFYHSIDILAMPSRRESFGMSAAEASATGLPVIASRVGGLPEVIEQGVNGILVEPENIQELAKAISSLANDPELRKRMGQNGVEMAKRKFNAEATVGKLINVYRRTLESLHTT
jgi:glycosyltransferase involved in cell wall biosynthesis